jgi:gliding motility-associated-like protein
LEIYNGVTPNGDGKNDFFYIGNIDQFPNNIVTIYSRWGQLISRIEKYDNADKKWNGHDVNNNVAPSGTYFFVIELGDGSKPIKGWIELINK